MDISLTQCGVTFPVKSAIVDGNPWVLYANIRYVGFLNCLEEGVHNDLTHLKGKICSVKCMRLAASNPHAILYNSSIFKDCVSWWNYGDERYLDMAVGGAGLWAVLGSKLMQRVGSGFGEGLKGSTWKSVIDSGVKQVSVGDSIVWAVMKDNKLKIKSKLSPDNLNGSEWQQLDADFGEVNNCSVGPNGVVWATDTKEHINISTFVIKLLKTDMQGKVHRRMGAKSTNPMGTKWQQVDGELILVTVGNAGVWGITPKQVVLYREGTYGLSADSDGRGWTKINGKMSWISSGDDIVWATSSDGSLWYRGGISQTNPSGNNWFKVDVSSDIKHFNWSKVSAGGSGLVGLDPDGAVLGTDTALSQHLIDGEGVAIYEGEENFGTYLINTQPSNIEVLAGAWIAFTNKNYKGTYFFHFEDETISNDPYDETEDLLKSWQKPLSSIRPMDHANFKSVEIENVVINWENVQVSLAVKTIDVLEDINEDATEYKTPSWPRIANYNVEISHRVDNVPKTNFSFVTEEGDKFETKAEFRQELSGVFTFYSPEFTDRVRKRTEMVRHPPVLEPMAMKKIFVKCHELFIEAPFTMTLRKGLKKWDVNGKYTGRDGTTLRLSYQDTNLNKITNGTSNGTNGTNGENGH